MSLILEIKVTPSSGRSLIAIDAAGRIKAYLKSPPEGGKANKELVKLLAQELSCPQALITILLGATSRTKKLKIDLPLTHDALMNRLGLALQTSLLK